MLYFDRINYEHFGTKREGLWTFVHFPFHLALVLLMEGAAQFIRWRKALEVLKYIKRSCTLPYIHSYLTHLRINNKGLLVAQTSFRGTTSAALATLYTEIVTPLFEGFSKEIKTEGLNEGGRIIAEIGNATFGSEAQLEATNKLFALVQLSLFENFGIEPPEKEGRETMDPTMQIENNRKAFKLIVGISSPH